MAYKISAMNQAYMDFFQDIFPNNVILHGFREPEDIPAIIIGLPVIYDPPVISNSNQMSVDIDILFVDSGLHGEVCNSLTDMYEDFMSNSSSIVGYITNAGVTVTKASIETFAPDLNILPDYQVLKGTIKHIIEL